MAKKAPPIETAEIPPMTEGDRALLLRAHDALEKCIKMARGSLTTLNCSSADVSRVANRAAEFKKMLDDANGRESWTFQPDMRDVVVLAITILIDRQNKVRKEAIGVGVAQPHDIDETIQHGKTIGRALNATMFPREEVQGDLVDDAKPKKGKPAKSGETEALDLTDADWEASGGKRPAKGKGPKLVQDEKIEDGGEPSDEDLQED
jgi:hypothetical protein